MRYKGKIITWKDEKGFGFVTYDGSPDKVFVHINSFLSRSRRPVEGEQITFEVELDEQRRSKAIKIRFADEKTRANTSSDGKVSFSNFFAVLFCLVLFGLFIIGKVPLSVLCAYLGLGTITFIAYAIDKSAAQNNEWRTKESTLHLFSLMGGWLGALVAQNKLRHKSKKEEFQTVFWATIILNCGAFGWLVVEGYFVLLKDVVGF